MRRLNKVGRELSHRGIDSFLITDPLNIRYLTGYSGMSAALLVLKTKAKLFVAKLNQEQALIEASGCDVISNEEIPIVQATKFCLSKRMKALGYETQLTYASYRKLRKLSKGITLKAIENLIEGMRIRKEEEVGFIRKSARITSQVFKEILPLVKPGMREYELAAEIEYRFRKNGADGCAFPPIVASGPNSSLPHANAGRRKIKKGDLLIIDLGCYYKGYASDMTRTIVIGKPSEKQRKVYLAVKEAQEFAMKATKAGIACKQLDKVARDVIKKWGFGERFIHSLGHGVGLAVHELPLISAKSAYKLEPGMVVTIEPGVYIPRWGGVRIEDMVLVGRNTVSILTTPKKELLEV